MILEDHMIKESCDFMGRKIIKVNYHLVKFGGHRHYVSEDRMISLSRDLIRLRDQRVM